MPVVGESQRSRRNEDGSIRRIYHHYKLWEEWTSSCMWKKVKAEDWDRELERAIKFIGDDEAYGQAMLRVIKKWKYSCEHNLSCISQNRRAWLGHAACALEKELSESVVRSAWGMLTEEQRVSANKKADEAIEEWESCQK